MPIYTSTETLPILISGVDEINKIQTEAIRKGAERALAKFKANNIPVKTGEYKNSWKVSDDENVITISNDASNKYGYYAEYVHRSGNSSIVAYELDDFILAETASIKKEIDEKLTKLFTPKQSSARIKL